ncbi:MAG: HAMP domain-containing sensor histidine kinase [Polyangiaceae bacterium]
MLDEFIRANRDDIIARTKAKVEARGVHNEATPSEGVPIFLDQLVARLHSDAPSNADIEVAATSHGEDMLHRGFSVKQVVQGYGDVCQAVTELAISRKASITTEEFRTLNRCLDAATAEAVTEYQRLRDRTISDQGTEHLGVLAHELRNVLNSAVISFEILKAGTVGVGGSTGAVLGRSLSSLREIIDRALAEVRLASGINVRKRIRVWELIEEVEVVATFEANNRKQTLIVKCADEGAEVDIDRHTLSAAMGNLLQNAFKFTREGGRVSLTAHVAGGRVLIDIEDECGGLPPGEIESLFLPFEQRGADRTGLGLGLLISKRGVEANGGVIRVCDRPGKGCVFTIDLPRAAPLGH